MCLCRHRNKEPAAHSLTWAQKNLRWRSFGLTAAARSRDTDHASTWKPLSPESFSLTLALIIARMDTSDSHRHENDRGSATEPRDDDDVSSLSDGEADRATVTVSAPARAEPSLCGVRAGKYSSWPRSEALGAALVIDRCAGGDVDIRSVILDFLENGLVLSHTFEYGEISFKANLPAMVCWSCRRKISKEHDCNLDFFSDDDVPSCDAGEVVLESCLCHPHDRLFGVERSEECKRGYARLVPELVRATGLWREHAAAHRSPYEPRRHLAANTYDCDFFDVIGELHPPSLRAMRAAGWRLSYNGWRCED